MPRVKRGKTTLKSRKKILKAAKGYKWGRKSKERSAKDALAHAGRYAFAHRRRKKGDMRRVWNVQVNAAARENGVSYSKLMGALKKKQVTLNRKMLAELAEFHPDTFAKISAFGMK